MTKNLKNILDQLEQIFQIRHIMPIDVAQDVPNPPDANYITNRNLEEQEKDPADMVETEPPMGDDEFNMGGMGGEKELDLDSSQIGRTYELKKIYSRLISITTYLSTSSDSFLLRLRNYVAQALEMFEILISNIETFLDKLDEIIIMFYKFLDIIYSLLKKYFEIQKNKQEQKNKQ